MPLLLTRPAAFGLGGGGSNNKNSKPSSTGDAMASAAAEAEAAAAKVGEAAASASEAAEALAARVAEEAAEAGVGASSALAPAAAPAAVAAPAASSPSLPSASVRSAAAGRGARARSVEGKKDGILSLLPQLGRQPAPSRRPTTLAGRRARGLARALLLAGVAYALLSLGAAVMRVARRANSPRAQRLRTVDRNKRVVESLNEVFLAATDSASSASSSSSSALTPALMKKLRSETGFTGPEIFRKYLWYLLRERRFDSTAVADLVSLRSALALTDAEVASAIKERAQRIYDKVREKERERKREEGWKGRGRERESFSSVSLERFFDEILTTTKKNSKKNSKKNDSTATSCSTSPA